MFDFFSFVRHPVSLGKRVPFYLKCFSAWERKRLWTSLWPPSSRSFQILSKQNFLVPFFSKMMDDAFDGVEKGYKDHSP